MTKGLSFQQVMSAMEARGVRFPISRELAIRYHDVPSNALELMEAEGLVRPGRLPKGVRLPPSTNDARTDSFVRDLTIIGVEWPAAWTDIHCFKGASPKVLRVLTKHGLILGPEIYDGTLAPTQVRALEALEITSKQEFREWVAGHDPEELRQYRNVGQHSIERLMKWAFGNEAPQMKRGLTVRLSPETKQGLEQLRIRRGLSSPDETIEELVAEALRASGFGSSRCQ